MKKNEITVYFNHFNNQGILRLNEKRNMFYLNKAQYLSIAFLLKYGVEKSYGKNHTVDMMISFLSDKGIRNINDKIFVREFNEKIPLKQIQLEITKRCNLRCKHCYIEEYKDILDDSAIYKLIDEAAKLGVMDFDLTGGEPLFYPNIDAIIEYILDRGMCTTIFSNGTILPEKIKKILKRYKGIKFRISLDGWNSETHDYIRGKGNFSKTIKTIHELEAMGVSVEINVVINSNNIIGAEKFIKLSKELKLRFRYDKYLPFFRDNHLLVSDEDYINFLYKLPEFYSKTKNIKKYDNHGFYCGAGNSYVFVTATGEISFCPTLSDSKFNAGNIKNDSLSNVWNHSTFFKNIRNIRCKFYNECPVSYICQGGCRSRAELSTGKIGEPDILECKLAYKISGVTPLALKGK